MSIWTSQLRVGRTRWCTSENLLADKKKYMSWLSLCMTVDLVIDVLQRDYMILTSKQLEEVSLRIITYSQSLRGTKSDRYVWEKNVIESMSINGEKCIWHLRENSYEQRVSKLGFWSGLFYWLWFCDFCYVQNTCFAHSYLTEKLIVN